MNSLHTFYNLDIKTVLEKLKTGENGLSLPEVEKRQAEFGKNIFHENSKNSFFKTFLIQFLSPLIFILLFAAGITFYLKEFIETIVILLAVFVNVFLSTYQEYKAENTIEKLKTFIKNKATVKRAGDLKQIDAEDLVVGDIVVLEYGSRVPADIRIISATDLKIDESILTGESLPTEKNSTLVTSSVLTDRYNYAFCGTLINNGVGVGVVTAIGSMTEIGKIARELGNTKKVLTPVQTAVNKISWYIFSIALFIVTFIFILGVYNGESIFQMLVLASAVAVGAVPEALPIALTVILSIGVLNISKKGGLIRKLAAAETLGSTTLVLTDKTGTLTEGKLTLNNILNVEELLNISFENDLSQSLGAAKKEILLLAHNNIFANVVKKGLDKSKWTYNGNAFDSIILKNIYDYGLEDRIGTKNNLVLPFNSTNKYSISKNDKEMVILGAPDILVNSSNLDGNTKEKLIEKIHLLSEEGKRLVAVGKKEFFKNDKDIVGMEILGLFIFSDVLRTGIKKSILEIEEKHVKVKIISGDLPGTVKYIANLVGISVLDDEILTGPQVANMTDEDLLQIIPKIKVFARFTPEDKLRIGKLYQTLGEIVAMTGDGVNDSTSLKAMDIGISLSSGSEVAKSASDMILMKNDFKTIVATISEGHNIKSNIQKVFIYLMSSSLDEIFVISGSIIASIPLPLSALQIIWVNVLTGTLPALAFAYDKNQTNSSSKTIFTNRVRFLSLGIGTISSLLLFFLYLLLVKQIDDLKLAQSVFFLCFSIYVLVIAFSFKNLNKYIWQYNPFDNWKLNLGVVVGLVFILLTIYSKIGQGVFDLVYVPTVYLFIVFAWLFFNLFLIEFSKIFFKTKSD